MTLLKHYRIWRRNIASETAGMTALERMVCGTLSYVRCWHLPQYHRVLNGYRNRIYWNYTFGDI